MIRTIIGFLIAIGAIIAILIVTAPATKGKKRIMINNTPVHVTIADTEAKRKQGLSNTPPLAQNEGMMFVFDTAGKYQFWMNDMNYDLDFVYVRDNKIVALAERVPAPKNNKGAIAIITPNIVFTHVIELPSGFIAENHIQKKQKVVF